MTTFFLYYFLFGLLFAICNLALTMHQIYFQKVTKEELQTTGVNKAFVRIAYLLLPFRQRLMINVKIFLLFFLLGPIFAFLYMTLGWIKLLKKEEAK